MAKTEFDIFHHTSTYPKADRIFVTELPSIDSVKDKCIFVLDTNALLVPFSTGSQSLDEIGKIFTLLKGKNQLKVPDQVAREFADNRPKKLGEMFHALSQKRNNMGDPKIGLYPLLEKLPEYNEALAMEKEIGELLLKYRKSIGKVIDTVKGWSWNDPVSILYKEIFTPDIIHSIVVDKEKIQQELNYRYEHKIPPGYKDEGKEDNGIGDYLIWLAIKDIGEKTKQDVVFVSGDEKPDWYHKSNKLPLYPRFELLSEFNNVSGNRSFHIIRLSELLDLMGADKNVISEVKIEEQIEKSRFAVPEYILAEKAVYFYFKNKFGNCVLQPNNAKNVYDFSYADDEGKITGVCVFALREGFTNSKFMVRDRLGKVSQKAFLSDVDMLSIVFVAKRPDFPAQKFSNEIENFIANLDFAGHTVSYHFGYLDESGDFCPIPRQIDLF